MEELLKKWKDRLSTIEEMENSNENTLFKRLEYQLKRQELETCYYELRARANSSNENSGLNIADVSQQRVLFNAILDFTENLPLVSEDYHRSELWEQFIALNSG